MSDTPAHRKRRRAVGDHQVETLTRYNLRSEAGMAQPPDEIWARVQARVAATPRPTRAVALSLPWWAVWWRDFMASAPRLSARLSSVGAMALLLLMLAHSTLSALPTDPTLPTSPVRAPYDALEVVRNLDRQALDTRAGVFDSINDRPPRPRPAYTLLTEDALQQPVYPAPESVADSSVAGPTEPEDPSTLVPPQSLPLHSNPIISPSTGDPEYRYTGATVR
jgi:hypothetical protein